MIQYSQEMQKGNKMHHLDRFRRESPGLYWLIIAALFLAGLWPVGLFLIISGGIRDSGQETEAVREKRENRRIRCHIVRKIQEKR